MSKEVEESDSFTFNESFSSKLFKIKIGTVSAQKEGEVEKQETRHKVCGGGGARQLACQQGRACGPRQQGTGHVYCVLHVSGW
jgi:hypothetical protein